MPDKLIGIDAYLAVPGIVMPPGGGAAVVVF